MTTIRKNRRAVFAELLLTTSPLEMQQHSDGTSLYIRFAAISELRAWLDAAGLDRPDLLTGEHTGVADGRPYRSMNAYPTWHGWEVYASAVEYIDPAPVDETTRDGLTALVAAG